MPDISGRTISFSLAGEDATVSIPIGLFHHIVKYVKDLDPAQNGPKPLFRLFFAFPHLLTPVGLQDFLKFFGHLR